MIKHELRKFTLYLKRATAGFFVATLTGAIAGLVLSLASFRSEEMAGRSVDFIGEIEWATIFGAIFGAPSAIFVMCLSRAKAAPWRSVPVLLVGTIVGIIILGLPWAMLHRFDILLGMCIISATIGGLFALRFLPKEEVDRGNRTER